MLPDKTYPSEPSKSISSFGGGNWHNIPVFRREDLHAGAKVSGPALLIDPFSTTVIEKDWEMVLNHYGAAIIQDKSVGQAGQGKKH